MSTRDLHYGSQESIQDLLKRQWTALAVLLSATAALPLFDMAVLSQSGVTPPFFHPAAFVVIAIAAALSWRRARASGVS